MKIIVLGGAGAMGSFAVEDLAARPEVELVTIADRDVERAAALAASLDDAPADVVTERVDALDHASLVRAIEGHDVAASCLGPFHRFEVPCALASAEAGVDYVSICDEWPAVLDLYDRVDEPARAAGVQVLTGMGASPGVTNVGASYLAAEMDGVDSIDIYVYQPLDAGGGMAVIQHMLFVISGEVYHWRNGARTMVRACSEHRDVEFPGHGVKRTWNMGHSEPVTMPRSFEGIREVNFWMGFGTGSELFVKPAQWGWFDAPKAAGRWAHGLEIVERLRRPPQPGEGAVRVDVTGTRDGESCARTLCGTGTMRFATGVALAVGARMVASGEARLEGGGVVAPEECIPPGPFVTELGARGLVSYRDIGMTEPIAT